MWKEYSCYLSERTGSRREGTLVPGSLPLAKARFFRVFDGTLKLNDLCNFV